MNVEKTDPCDSRFVLTPPSYRDPGLLCLYLQYARVSFNRLSRV